MSAVERYDEPPEVTERHLGPSTRALVLSSADRELVYKLIVAQLGEQGLSVTPDEFLYFIRVAEARGLNPLFREVHLIKDKTGRINVQVGIDGFRKLAEDSGDYAGQSEPQWGEPYSGPIVEWQGKPGYVKVGVYRHSWERPYYGEAWLDEDGQVKSEWADSPNGRRVQVASTHAQAQWATRPRTMLKKVAEARAIRAAFPRSVAGLYTDDELPGHVEATPQRPSLMRDEVTGELPGTPSRAEVVDHMTNEQVGMVVTGRGPDEAPVEGEWRPPELPEGTQAVVREAPDGVRMVKSGAHPPRWDGVRAKLEVKVKVKNRNHTLMLFEDLAYAADAAGIEAEEQLIYSGGHLEERIWQEGKPPIKEVWDITGLRLFRDGAWLDVNTIERPRQEVLDMPLVDSTLERDPTPAVAATPSATGSSASADEPPPLEAPPPEVPAPKLEEGAVVTAKVRLTGPIAPGSTARGTAFARLVGVIVGSGEIVKMALGDEPEGEVAAQLRDDQGGWLYDTGDELIAVGTVAKGWLLLTYIGREAKDG